MTAEQQLERSVLEGKERDELSAIAQAMSLKTTTRTKKADIIDQILDATGVTSGPAPGESSNGDAGTNGAKPARRSRASAAARGAADAASFVSGDGDAGGIEYLVDDVGLFRPGRRLERHGLGDGTELIALLAFEN